jgi:mycothiol synthase
MDVVPLSEIDRAGRQALIALLQRADAADDYPPLPEPQYHAVVDDGSGGGAGGGEVHDGRLVLAESDGALAGFALLTPARDGSTAIHLVVDPERRDGELASALVAAAVADAGAGGDRARPLHLWAMHAGPADDDLARHYDFEPERDVVQMRVPLPLSEEVVRATRPVVTRPFVPGQDDEAWLRVNNRAFASHPEQGSWTAEQLHERLAADWVDLEGFLVADDPDGDGLIGFCWTKVHRGRTPVLGEIYVIGVDPAHHGSGLGRALTVAGLNSIAERGIRVGMLYTDADNEAAMALYRHLGFEIDHVDRSYRLAGAPRA